MILKCKICGANLNINQGDTITACEYCGIKQSIPTFNEPKTEEIYNRANNYLMHNEFDKAENLFNQILFDDNSNADAYWNVLMCRYGVSYVKDPASGKYIPTCNRTLYTPIFNDENYKKALQYADEAQKELYSIDAKTIDEIQKGILAVSRKEKPFDIFISYKETDIKGTRTQDSIVAQDLYNKLTAEGYKVFFSRITLEDKAGTEYEPYIYAALASSKVMITICSSRENIEAVWVKNEWSRYLSFSEKDSEKNLIPLYFDMDKSNLPGEFANLSACDMKVDGFEQELIRGIKKLIPLPVILLEQRKRRNKILKKVGVGAVACAVVGIIISIPWFMKIPKYNDAMQLYYDKNYAEATWAFDDLGSYCDSKKMKEKCELSWRRSLATIATRNEMGAFANELYYINQNGAVEYAINKPGAANLNIAINEHGKIISIGDHPTSLYALHEDGYVQNAMENNDLAQYDTWESVVQISPVFNTTNVALRSDGKIVIGNTANEFFYVQNDDWLKPLLELSDVKEFAYNIIRMDGYVDAAVVLALKSDGTISGVANRNTGDLYSAFSGTVKNSIEETLNMFDDVKHICAVGVNSSDNLTDYLSSGGSIPLVLTLDLDLIVITNDGKVQSYINGVFEEYDAEKIVDINFWYELHDDGNIYDKKTDEIILSDMILLSNDLAFKSDGSIYDLLAYSNVGSEPEYIGKTTIHNELIERKK